MQSRGYRTMSRQRTGIARRLPIDGWIGIDEPRRRLQRTCISLVVLASRRQTVARVPDEWTPCRQLAESVVHYRESDGLLQRHRQLDQTESTVLLPVAWCRRDLADRHGRRTFASSAELSGTGAEPRRSRCRRANRATTHCCGPDPRFAVDQRVRWMLAAGQLHLFATPQTELRCRSQRST